MGGVAREIASMKMQPVGGNVQSSTQLEEEHVSGIDVTECRTEEHEDTSVDQLIEHHTKPAALVQPTGCNPIKYIQQGTCHIAKIHSLKKGC